MNSAVVPQDAVIPERQNAPVNIVRVKIESNELRRGEWVGAVKLGMAGQVEIVTGEEPLLHLLMKKIRLTRSVSSNKLSAKLVTELTFR